MVSRDTGGVGMMDPNKRDVKMVRVSKQRQVNIPKEYYDSLDLGEEAYIENTGSSLIIRPVKREAVDFSEFILRDLVEDGYTGEDLIERFTEVRSQIPEALDSLIQDSMKGSRVEGDLDNYLETLEEEKDE